MLKNAVFFLNKASNNLQELIFIIFFVGSMKRNIFIERCPSGLRSALGKRVYL